MLTDPAAGDPQHAGISSVLEQVNALAGTPGRDVSDIFLLYCPDNTAESLGELQIDTLISAGFRLSEGTTESAVSLRGAFDALRSARRSYKLEIKGSEANHREKRRLVCSHTGLSASY